MVEDHHEQLVQVLLCVGDYIHKALGVLKNDTEGRSHLVRDCRSEVLQPVILLILLVHLVDQLLQVDVHSHAREVENEGRHQMVGYLFALDCEHFLLVLLKGEKILSPIGRFIAKLF